MRRALSILLAGAVAVTGAAASLAPAQAAMPQAAPLQAQDRGAIVEVETDRQSQWWYNQRRHGGDSRHGWRDGGRGWDRDRGWRGRDDDRWRRHGYYRRHHDRDDGAGLALGLFGLAAGALVGSQLGAPAYGGGYDDPHDAACAARFRSYDPYSNTYLGYDGLRHYC